MMTMPAYSSTRQFNIRIKFGIISFFLSFVTSFNKNVRISHRHQRPLLSLVRTPSATTTSSGSQQTEGNEVHNGELSVAPPVSRCIKAVTSKTGPLNEAVANIADVSLEKANELIDIGAVWAKLELLSREDILGQYGSDTNDFDIDNEGNINMLYADLPTGYTGSDYYINPPKKRKDDDGSFSDEQPQNDELDEYISKMENQRYKRILTPCIVETGTDIRVYTNPRRFPSCYSLHSKNSLLYEDTTFIVVDKPPMLPTQPDTSNYYECVPGCVNDILGPFTDINGQQLKKRPFICHRVDTVVGGCIVLSKDRNGQKVFSRLQRERKIKKIYLAVTTNPVPIGIHICWLWKPNLKRGSVGKPPSQLVRFSPPESRRKAREYWTRCILEVVKCEPITIPTDNLGGYDVPVNKQHYQSTIRLVTGRKHQVRAQLASLGCPIIQDTLYEPISGMSLDTISSSVTIDPSDEEDNDDIELEEENTLDKALTKCTVPTKPIGLQAHAILFGGIRAKAKTPWWQQEQEQ